MQSDTLLTIVVPCYNESETIPSLLRRYSEVIGARKDIKVVLVNDGSKDTTREVLEQEKEKHTFLDVIHVYPNGGYGNAVVTGLQSATSTYVGWTHGDSQTPPEDTLRALEILENSKNKEMTYVKGLRHGRPFGDVVFTFGMSVFETLLFQKVLFDINAQPNIFPRSFFESWVNPPKDFSLDLYSLYFAKKNTMTVIRFPVSFNKRTAGVSSWNINWKSKMKFIKRTVSFSFALRIWKLFH